MSWEKIITQGMVNDADLFKDLLLDAGDLAITGFPSNDTQSFALSFGWDASEGKVEWKTVDLSSVGTGTLTGVDASDGYLSVSNTNAAVPDITLATGSIDIAAINVSGTTGTGKVLTDAGDGTFAWADDAEGSDLPTGQNGELLMSNGVSWTAANLAAAGVQGLDATLTALAGLDVTHNGNKNIVMLTEDNGGVASASGTQISADVEAMLGSANDAAILSNIGAQPAGDYISGDSADNLVAGTTLGGSAIATETYADGVVAGYALLSDPDLTGTPTAPTAGANINTTQIATTAFVQQETANFATTTEVTTAVGDSLGTNQTVFGFDLDNNGGTHHIKSESGKIAFYAGNVNSSTNATIEALDLSLTGGGGVTWDGTATIGTEWVEVNTTYSFSNYATLDGFKGGYKVQRDPNNDTVILPAEFSWNDTADELESGTGWGGDWKAAMIYNDGAGGPETAYQAPLALKLVGADIGGSPTNPTAMIGQATEKLNTGAPAGTMFVGTDGIYIKTS